MLCVPAPREVPVVRRDTDEILVLECLVFSTKGSAHLPFYGFLEGPVLAILPRHLLVVGVGSLDRVHEQRYEPRPRDHPRHPLGGGGLGHVRAGLPCNGPPPVLP